MMTGYYISAICPVLPSSGLFEISAFRQVKLTTDYYESFDERN